MIDDLGVFNAVFWPVERLRIAGLTVLLIGLAITQPANSRAWAILDVVGWTRLRARNWALDAAD